jgi:hypothetical protein
MAWIKKNQSSLHKRHTGQELAPCGQPFRDFAQIWKVLLSSIPRVTWLFGLSSQNMKSTRPTHVEYHIPTDFFRLSSQNMKSTRPTHAMYGLTFLRLPSHMVGKGVCLVMLWQNPARRDKPWNYIPLKFQRYTKLNLATRYLYGHVENVWGIPFPKRMEWKYCFLSELFQEQVFWLQIEYMLIDLTANDYK